MGRYFVDYYCFRYCNLVLNKCQFLWKPITKLAKLNKLLSVSRVLRAFFLTVVVWSPGKIYKGVALRISQGNGGY